MASPYRIILKITTCLATEIWGKVHWQKSKSDNNRDSEGNGKMDCPVLVVEVKIIVDARKEKKMAVSNKIKNKT